MSPFSTVHLDPSIVNKDILQLNWTLETEHELSASNVTNEAPGYVKASAKAPDSGNASDLDATILFSLEDYMEIVCSGKRNVADDFTANVDPNEFLFDIEDGVTINLNDDLDDDSSNVMDDASDTDTFMHEMINVIQTVNEILNDILDKKRVLRAALIETPDLNNSV